MKSLIVVFLKIFINLREVFSEFEEIYGKQNLILIPEAISLVNGINDKWQKKPGNFSKTMFCTQGFK